MQAVLKTNWNGTKGPLLPNKGNLFQVQGHQLNTAQGAAKAHSYRCLPVFSMCRAPKKHIHVVHVHVDYNMFSEYKHIKFAVREGDHVQVKNTDQLKASAGLKFISSNIKHKLIKYMSSLTVLYDTTGYPCR